MSNIKNNIRVSDYLTIAYFYYEWKSIFHMNKSSYFSCHIPAGASFIVDI